MTSIPVPADTFVIKLPVVWSPNVIKLFNDVAPVPPYPTATVFPCQVPFEIVWPFIRELIVENDNACLWLPIAYSPTFPWNPVVLTSEGSASYACTAGAANEP